MGKRKSRVNKSVKKPVQKFDTVFVCPFCNHARSVDCKIYKSKDVIIGTAECYVCEARYDTSITTLHEAIHIYSEWIDECERVNKRHRCDQD